jgi:hypothetical protein
MTRLLRLPMRSIVASTMSQELPVALCDTCGCAGKEDIAQLNRRARVHERQQLSDVPPHFARATVLTQLAVDPQCQVQIRCPFAELIARDAVANRISQHRVKRLVLAGERGAMAASRDLHAVSFESGRQRQAAAVF